MTAMLVTVAALIIGAAIAAEPAGSEQPGRRGGGELTPSQVLDLAAEVVNEHGLRVEPRLVAAVAMAESAGDPTARRQEPSVSDVSLGLMQTLTRTAQAVADRGFVAFGQQVPVERLIEPRVSLYYGAAYLSVLRRWQGRQRDTAWVLRSYNGGPGADSEATRDYARRVQRWMERMSRRLAAGGQ